METKNNKQTYSILDHIMDNCPLAEEDKNHNRTYDLEGEKIHFKYIGNDIYINDEVID